MKKKKHIGTPLCKWFGHAFPMYTHIMENQRGQIIDRDIKPLEFCKRCGIKREEI